MCNLFLFFYFFISLIKVKTIMKKHVQLKVYIAT